MHVPVMLHEAMEFLDVQTDGYYIDATLGQGGHAARVLERLTTGKLLGIDCDPTAVRRAQERMKPSDDRFLFLEGNFEDIDKLHAEAGLPPVQGVLAARIDRLRAEEKELLQQLSVIGRQFPAGLVRKVVSHPEEELYRLLSSLQAKEYLYEQPAFPEVEYIFKHALTQEVAYGTVLQEQRKALHERTGQAIERRYETSLDDHYSELAQIGRAHV